MPGFIRTLLICVVLVVNISYQLTDGACEFPPDLRGDWYTTSNGLVTFSNDSISNFKSLIHPSTHTYNCEYIDNGRYITRARIPILSTSNYDVYFCMSFTKITETKYLVQYNSDMAGFVNERVVGVSVQSSTTTLLPVGEACNLTTSVPTGTQEVYVKKGNESSNFITCPESVASILDMTLNSGCYGNVMDGMSYPNYLIHSYNSSCASTQYTFTTSGNLSCMYSAMSGASTYLTVYNLDTTTDEISTYRFFCYVITSGNDQVYLTYHPKICQTDQTSTYVTSPGVIAYLVDRYKDAAPSDDEVPIGVVAGILVPIVLLLGMVLFIIYWKIKHRQKINHELELAARRNWKKLAEKFTPKTKHTVEKAENSSKMGKKKRKKKKKKGRKENCENQSVHSHTDSRRRSVWFDDFNNTIEEIQEPQPWQRQWEAFNDPLNKQTYDDDRGTPNTARSISSVQKIWLNPDNTEKVEVESTWDNVANFLANIRKRPKQEDFLQPQ
ncbi:uncharacterized protein LOC128155940 [Crassostrea angulata]|uniref:uncharacterized protein LOC128155940 n=1 Tax=Magallana angulata TaxID=2784310 RepID=UPI0022B1B91B|nr:uncharacterized protein LOC128155940 [Crassostrea angulata]